MSQFVPLEMKAGSVVILNGCNVHGSSQNTSGISRHAYSVHYVESGLGVEYLKDNWYVRHFYTVLMSHTVVTFLGNVIIFYGCLKCQIKLFNGILPSMELLALLLVSRCAFYTLCRL